jgi:nicotinate-nucleotide pyrophosphorylase (carboxylating)
MLERLAPTPPHSAVQDAVIRAFLEDIDASVGDVSASLLDHSSTGRFGVISREEGVLAGRACAEAAFILSMQSPFGNDEPYDTFALEMTWHRFDGDELAPGTLIAEVCGPLRPILTAERTALNFLTHLSGIASLTASAVRAVDGTGVLIKDTRKTIPGLRVLEKAAVRAGGGSNHRMGLSDAFLIKDNHLAHLSITDAVKRAKDHRSDLFVEVECDDVDHVVESFHAGADGVLLDNMSPETIRHCVATIKEVQGNRRFELEVSGGVTIQSIHDYAQTGIDVISLGALTHSAPAFDIGLDDLEEKRTTL